PSTLDPTATRSGMPSAASSSSMPMFMARSPAPAPNAPMSGFRQVAAEPAPDLLPPALRGVDVVARAVDREERVTGPLVGVELVRLALGTQLVLDPRHVLGRRVAVLGAEQAQQRAAELRRQIDGRPRAVRRQVVRSGDDPPAIAVDGGIQGQRAGR